MSQSLSNILIHIIFSTKSRKNIIDKIIEPELYAYIVRISKEKNSPIKQIGGTENHIHLLVALSRNLTVAKFVAEIKANSSRWIKAKNEKYRYFSWQNGYGAFSIGQSIFPICLNYIKNQKQHHKQFSFEDELKQLLEKYKVEYNEDYLFS